MFNINYVILKCVVKGLMWGLGKYVTYKSLYYAFHTKLIDKIG